MNFRGNFTVLNFDKTGFQKEFQKILEAELLKAVRAWFDVMVSIVPVWTGEAQGALGPVADAIGRFVPVAIRDSSATAPENRVAKGRAQGRFEMQVQGFKATMFWESNVEHFLINEVQASKLNLRFPTPWHARQQAGLAFLKQVKASFPEKTPNPFQFLKRTSIKLS